MLEQSIISESAAGISDSELKAAMANVVEAAAKVFKKPRRALLIPPDFTRLHSGAGRITAILYDMLKDGCHIDVLPALGTHAPMTERECAEFFGPGIPYSAFIRHDWRNDIIKIGEVPGEFVREVSEGLVNTPIEVELNKRIMDKSCDLIISIGQVVPHEVAGMANYSKNLFVGCGGSGMINASHMLGAFYGMERMMGRDLTPVRRVFDYAQERFIADLPLVYILTVTSVNEGHAVIHGLFTGAERGRFEEAAKLSREKNITFVDEPIKKAVVWLDPAEFRSAWLGNKAIYRTRMAIADGSELVVIGPGISKFGEDARNDELIRKYGYIGREAVLKLCDGRGAEDLRENLSVAAHLIHGSSDGRFSVTYAAGGLTRQEVEGAGFKYMPIDKALALYDVSALKDGYNTLASGEEIYYISNPALGLWASEKNITIFDNK